MCSRRPAQVRGRSSSRGIRGRPEALISFEDKRTSADCMIFFKSIKKINLLTHAALIANFTPMITINHSWSLGLCPNKSLEAFESPVRPRQGDHPERFSEEISEMGGEILALDEAEGTGNIRSDLSRVRQRSPAAKDPDPFRKFVLRTALTPENDRLSVPAADDIPRLSVCHFSRGRGGSSLIRSGLAFVPLSFVICGDSRRSQHKSAQISTLD